MREITKAGGLDKTGKRLTNHSVRRTTIKMLKKQGVPSTHIAAITGHHNEQSLQQYAEMENTEHAEIGRILCGESIALLSNTTQEHREALQPIQLPLTQSPLAVQPSTPQTYNFT